MRRKQLRVDLEERNDGVCIGSRLNISSVGNGGAILMHCLATRSLCV